MKQTLSRVTAGAMLLLSVAAFGACDDDDDPVGPRDITQDLVNSIQTDAHVMGLLHQSNLGEIDAGELARDNANDTEVKSFATMMVNQHTTLDAQSNALAAQLGITPSAPTDQLEDRQDEEVSQLALTTGTTFDRNYIAKQVVAHTRTLALVDAGIAKVQNATLKISLQTTVRPTVAEHLQMAQAIQVRLGTP